MVVLLLVFSSGAAAADPVLGANSLAMGGTGVAAANDNVAITFNPGVLPLTERYDFQGSFAYGPDAGLHWSGSAMDARTSDSLAAGIVYSGDRWEPSLTENDLPGWQAEGEPITNVRRLHEFAGALAVPLADRRLGIGIGGTIGWFDHDRHGDGLTFDLTGGLGARPADWLALGAAIRNFLPGAAQDRDLTLAGGARCMVEGFEAEIDLGLRPDGDALPATVGLGAEVAAGAARIRAGWRLDEKQVSSLSAGLGWDREGAALDYGFAIPLRDVSFASTVHQITLRFGASAPIADVY